MTLLRLTKEHDFAVIELGANHGVKLPRTVSLTRPEAALVNNPPPRIWKVSVHLKAWRKPKVRSIPACRITVSPL